MKDSERKDEWNTTEKSVAKKRLNTCSNTAGCTWITPLNFVHRYIDLWNLEIWCKLTSVESWDYSSIFWIEFLLFAHAYIVLSVTLLLCICDSRLENSATKTYWDIWDISMQWLFLCNFGRRLPFLRDSNSIFPGEINLKILLANWPSSANRCNIEMYQVMLWFSSTQIFQHKILPKAFHQLIKLSKNV